MFPFSEMMMTRTYRIHDMFSPKLSKGGPLVPNWNQIIQNSEMIFFVPKLFCSSHKFAVCCQLNLSQSIHCIFFCWFLLSKAFSFFATKCCSAYQLSLSWPIHCRLYISCHSQFWHISSLVRIWISLRKLNFLSKTFLYLIFSNFNLAASWPCPNPSICIAVCQPNWELRTV